MPAAIPAAATAPLVQATDLCARLGNCAVGPFTLNLRAGEQVAILGPSGAGKSTLLRLLSGELHPTRGALLFDGRAMRHWKHTALSARRAVLPQQVDAAFGLQSELVVALGRVGRAVDPARDDIVHAALALARMPHAHGRGIHTLSGGERARVQMARVFAQLWDVRDGLLLVDEPIAALDPGLQFELMDGLHEFAAARNHALVAVLHDVNHALARFDRLVLIRDGAQIADMPADAQALPALERLYGVGLEAVQLADGRWAAVAQRMRRSA